MLLLFLQVYTFEVSIWWYSALGVHQIDRSLHILLHLACQLEGTVLRLLVTYHVVCKGGLPKIPG